MEEVQTTKRTSENLLAGLEASRISIAESENTEILELRDNIKASQEETARLTGKGGGGGGGGPHYYSISTTFYL